MKILSGMIVVFHDSWTSPIYSLKTMKIIGYPKPRFQAIPPDRIQDYTLRGAQAPIVNPNAYVVLLHG